MAIDDLYDAAFYQENLDNRAQYDALGDVIHSLFTPVDVYEVGCGAGLVMARLAQLGWDVTGIDGSSHAIASAPVEVRHRIFRVDLLGPWNHRTRCCDVAICIEVAEHLPDSSAIDLVSWVAELPRISGHIVWSAAYPGQGGVGHINERPDTYWMSMFVNEGWIPDTVKTNALRTLMWAWKAQHCYARDNFFVLRRTT